MPFTPAVTPLEPPYEPAMEATLRKWMPPGAPFEPLALFRTLGKNASLMDAMLPLGRYFLGKTSPLSLRTRELVILRACARAGCEYEWGVHVTAFADAAGLSADDISAVTSGKSDDNRWTTAERTALLACDDIMGRAILSEPVKTQLGVHYSESEIMALITLVSWYRLIATVANSCCAAPEAWAARFSV
ncbi:carboxymuconolactone decarboxylase family protein [Kordiimonas sp.]|uniref:carboxymuconolactone decarboxylase family protein n=1 Tax=Kordiimonas sp. TaxID=1970157 RepID=UPI003A954EE6